MAECDKEMQLEVRLKGKDLGIWMTEHLKVKTDIRLKGIV